MPAIAKYSLLIPKVDNLGNPLNDIAAAAHEFLYRSPLNIQGSYVEPGKRSFWRDSAPEEHDMLVTYAEDSPEMDSTIKQLAHYVAEVANQWGIFVTKEGGKSGIQTWIVNNSQFRQNEPADALALAQDPAIYDQTGGGGVDAQAPLQ